MEDAPKRQVAVKVRLSDLTGGVYVKVSGEWDPNYVKSPDGKHVSRANIIATVISEPMPELNYNSFLIDDGTAQVPVRIFSNEDIGVNLGDVVLIIGRPREFNQQIYVVPDIVKPLHENKEKWLELRKIELEQNSADIITPESKEPSSEKELPKYVEQPDIDENIDEVPSESPIDKLIELIRELDKGDGADTEEVIEASDISNAEQMITALLKEGEIFEITSGKIKVLD